MRRTGITVLVMMLALLGGCVGKIIKKGDAALAADRPATALQHYREALRKKPDLVEDETFVGKLKQAEVLAAYQEGVALAERREWEPAIRKFEESLTLDPAFEQARRALSDAKRAGSKDYHARALRSADEGRLNDAVTQLQRAIELDPANLDAKEALESVSQKKTIRRTEAQELYSQSLKRQEEKRWSKASDSLAAAIAANPNHLPARAALHQCKAKLARAGELYAAGTRLLGEKQLDKAIASLTGALEVWPFHDGARPRLAEAEALRTRAEELLAEAKTLAAQRRWDETVEAAERSLAIFPFHGETVALARQAKREAADAHCDAGDKLLAAGKLGAAEGEFSTAFRYVPDMNRAKDGLAEVCAVRGRGAADDGLWGAALLWHMKAAGHSSAPRYRAGVGEARSAVLERIGFTLAVDVTRGGSGSGVPAAEVRSVLPAAMAASAPGFLSTVQGAGAPPTYTAAVEPGGIDIEKRLVYTERRTHAYTVRREVANPELPHTAALLRSAEGDLARLESRFAAHCPHCRGAGHLPRPNSQQGKRPAGRAGPGRTACPQCRGTGRQWPGEENRLNTKRREVQHLRDRLRSTPPTVWRDFPAQWEYAVLHYEKTGRAAVHVAIRDDAGGDAAAPFAVTESTRYTDSVIENANPGIGLRQDSLDLPSDTQVRRRLIDGVTTKTAKAIVTAVLRARIAETEQRAARLARAADGAGALEARVDAALLTEPLDPGAAKRALAALQP
ncbi:MAG TPA: hypothetical protein VMZ50_05120 [Phycisphaerae bacterium]|nr:hypothetical protein [Phycisphaerae bacterium]